MQGLGPPPHPPRPPADYEKAHRLGHSLANRSGPLTGVVCTLCEGTDDSGDDRLARQCPASLPPEKLPEEQSDREAYERQRLWEALGCPARDNMSADEYKSIYAGRTWAVSKAVMRQLIQVRKLILCPKCIEDTPHGSVTATPMLITVEDDVMTVFAALGHAVCHHCGFEEYYPLRKDPRKDQRTELIRQKEAEIRMAQQRAMMQASPMLGQQSIGGIAAQQPNLLSPVSPMAGSLGNPIAPMLPSEYAALQNIYAKASKSGPDKIGNMTRETAMELLASAPPEKRAELIKHIMGVKK